MTAPGVRNIEPGDLAQDPGNANRGTARGRYMVGQSIDRHGAGRGIVVDRKGRAIAGNKTLEAAVDAGIRLVMIDTEGDVLVVTRRTDMDLDDPATGARSLAYADNRAAETGLSWDGPVLKADLAAGLDLGDWFFADELAALANLGSDDDPAGGTGEGEGEGNGESPGAVFKVEIVLSADQAVPFWEAARTIADGVDVDVRTSLSRIVLAALFRMTRDAAEALDERDVLTVIRSGRFPEERGEG